MKGKGRWWRAYEDALNNPKLQRLPAALFKAWFNLCCIASRNDGRLPACEDISFALRVSESQASKIVSELVEAGLIDMDETGVTMHDWNEHQYKSDVSTERVKRFRKRNETVPETPPDTEQSRADTDRVADATPLEKPVRASRRSPKSPLPQNLELTEEWRLVAREKGLAEAGIAREFEKFTAHARANDRRCADWKAAWRNWILNAIGYDPKLVQSQSNGGATLSPADQERVWAIKCERATRDGLPEAAWQVPSEFIARWKTTRTQAEAG